MKRRNFLQLIAGLFAAPVAAAIPSPAEPEPTQTVTEDMDIMDMIWDITPKEGPLNSVQVHQAEFSVLHEWVCDPLT
jgi:hypothetical protein